MSAEIERRLEQSSADFLNVVWPAIGKGFGRPIPVETVTENGFADELDRRAGIDVWLVSVDGHMRGLGSRVQWPKQGRSFDTFTIRLKSRYGRPTEFHKRRAEIAASGAIRPHYACHAYVSTDHRRLLGAAIALMSDVIKAVEDGVGWLMPPNADGTQGWAVPWGRLAARGCPIVVWPEKADPFDPPAPLWGGRAT